MYRDFFGFKEKPFTITPNPRFVFLSKNHKEAFAHLLYGIDNHAGFILLTGEVGTGKTTVLRTLLGQLDKGTTRCALILNPCLSARELLAGINREFGIAWEQMTGPELLETLNRFLLAENRAGHTVVLVIDEAQNLEPQVLEQIRLISNLETETDKLIQIVLAGQPELLRLLRKPELRQLEQRITVRYHLTAMDFGDTALYIEHRLEVAGGWRAATFTKPALKKIFANSRGIPRIINIICDRALLIGYIEENREISGRMAARAVAEVREKKRPAGISPLAWGAMVVVLLIAVGAAYLFTREAPVKVALSEPARVAPATAETTTVSDTEQAESAETASAVKAFSALATLWNIPAPAGGVVVRGPADLDTLAEKNGIYLAHFTGGLKRLLAADSPALIEFAIPSLPGKRYLALLSHQNDQFSFAPPLNGQSTMTRSDLEKLWSGRAYLPWRNFRNIPRLEPGMSGDGVTRLQELLSAAGVYRGELSGVYGRQTTAAVRAFQAAHGIAQTGRPGKQTLFFLYHAGGGFAIPRLEKKGGEQKG